MVIIYIKMLDKLEQAIADCKEAVGSLDAKSIRQASELISSALKAGNKVLVAGNGGSAADAQHMAAELVGRYLKDRQALAAIALTTDTSILTALANDFGAGHMFKRQVEALGKKGDVLVAFSTSGMSENILEAASAAKALGLKVVSFTGVSKKGLGQASDVNVSVASDSTPRIQEAHSLAYHLVCELVEEGF